MARGGAAHTVITVITYAPHYESILSPYINIGTALAGAAHTVITVITYAPHYKHESVSHPI